MNTGNGSRAPGIGGMRHPRLVEQVRKFTPEPVVRVTRAGSRWYGTRTSFLRPLPDFLVIGAKKGGTTSLANWLSHHPHVLPMFPRFQRAKSPHYFDINYWRGDDWYRSHFPSIGKRRLHQARTGVTPLVGESSPYYLFHPAAPQRIRQTAPTVKMVAVLRDPVSRAYSHYWDRVATGFEPLGTFEEAIDAEKGRLRGVSDDELFDPRSYNHDHDHHTYLARGRYAEQLRRYFEVFDAQQLLVLSAESLFHDSEATFARLERFLGLDPVQIELPAMNVRNDYPKIAPATAERLREHYASANADLFDLLGETFDW